MLGRRRKNDVVNKLSMTDENAILSLLRLGWSERRIARDGGHNRSAIRRIRREAGLAPSKRTTAPEVPTESAAAKRSTEIEVPTDSAATRSSAAPFRDLISVELDKGRNATAIYQDLVEHLGYEGSYDAVKRLARKLRKTEPKIACRYESDPGEDMRVDYGDGALTRDPRTGKYRRPRLFALTLGNSRHAFRKTIWKSSSQTWCELHEEAFAYFGGAARTIRLDNLKERVIKPGIYDPQLLNALYAKMLDHYASLRCPAAHMPQILKGKVESAVGYTRATALRGKRFEGIEEQNAYLMRWNERWAATRIHGTTKR
jgi:transposase